MEMIASTPWQMWVTFALILAGVISYSIDRIPMEMSSVGIIVAFLIFFHFFPIVEGDPLSAEQILSGFANPALLAILSLMVMGQGLFHSGALERPTRWLVEHGTARPYLVLVFSLVSVLCISAFMNNTPVVVMFIPIVSALAVKLGVPTSQVMMPLSFFSVFGGMLTLIGSSTNLLAAQAMTKADPNLPVIGFFDFTPIGAILATAGALYVLAISPFIPKRSSLAGEMKFSDGRQFIAQIDLTPDHPLVGVSPVAGLFKDLPDITVRVIQRRETAILPPFEDVTLNAGDTLIVAATRQKLSEILAINPDLLRGMMNDAEFGADIPENAPRSGEIVLAEAVVAPGSRVVGSSLSQIGFHYQTGCIVLGIQRQSRMIRMKMNDIRLEAGDVLLLLGNRANVDGLRANRDVLLLDWSTTNVPKISHAGRARLIFLGCVGAAALDIVPIVTAGMAGAGLMLASGCLNVRQAARAIDRKILLLVAAALAMGAALQSTGGAEYIANLMLTTLSAASVPVILSAFFLVVAALTNVLSNNATAVLFTPIAVNVAERLNEVRGLDIDPTAFVIAVILAANTSFATPMAYQTNLLVMGPGHYKFRDFLVIGGPLSIVIWLTFSLFAPWYFGL